MPPRILILSASVGAGHMRAAQALEVAFSESVPDAHVRNVDVLDLTNAAFRRVYGTAYLDLVNKAPHVLGYFYDLLDRPPRTRGRAGDRLRRVVQRLNLTRLTRFLASERWDLVVNTHFLSSEIIASLQRRKKFHAPQVTVTTDFETHRLWVHQPCERYFTATEEGALYLPSWGVPEDDTRVTGIPIHPDFSRGPDRDNCRADLGLTGARPVVLQLAGGFGVGPVARLFQALLEVDAPMDLLTVCGRNERLRTQLSKVVIPARHSARVFGFTKEMDRFMRAADIVVTKPGGLTTSEALACGCAMVVVNPIPGQESRNSDFLLENGAAIKVNNVATLPHKVGGLLADRDRLARLKSISRRLGRPRAAFDVVDECLSIIGQTQNQA